MTYHERIEVPKLLYGLTGQCRLDAITARIAEEREALRTLPAGALGRDIAERNIADLERHKEMTEADVEARTRRRAATEAERTAKREERQQADQAALEARLRGEYDRTLPVPTTDTQWEAVRESVVHRHALREMDALDQTVAAKARAFRI